MGAREVEEAENSGEQVEAKFVALGEPHLDQSTSEILMMKTINGSRRYHIVDTWSRPSCGKSAPDFCVFAPSLVLTRAGRRPKHESTRPHARLPARMNYREDSHYRRDGSQWNEDRRPPPDYSRGPPAPGSYREERPPYQTRSNEDYYHEHRGGGGYHDVWLSSRLVETVKIPN